MELMFDRRAFVAWHTPEGSCGKFLDDLMMVKWVTCKTKIGNAVDALSGTFRAVSRGYTAKLLSEGNKARLRMECGLCAARCCCPRCAYALHPAARRWFVCKYLYHTLSKFLTRRANFRSKSPAQHGTKFEAALWHTSRWGHTRTAWPRMKLRRQTSPTRQNVIPSPPPSHSRGNVPDRDLRYACWAGFLSCVPVASTSDWISGEVPDLPGRVDRDG